MTDPTQKIREEAFSLAREMAAKAIENMNGTDQGRDVLKQGAAAIRAMKMPEGK